MDRAEQSARDKQRLKNKKKAVKENREHLLDALLEQDYIILVTGVDYLTRPDRVRILSQQQIESYIQKHRGRLLDTPEESWGLISLQAFVKQVWQDGCLNGQNESFPKGQTDGYKQGYSEGYDAGRDEGYSEGYDEGYSKGYSEGYSEGDSHGYSSGYDDGLRDG